MAKSQRSKREKRLRSIRREISEPFYDKKEDAKLAVQAAALAAPKLPVRTHSAAGNNAMDIITAAAAATTTTNNNNKSLSMKMDVDMAEGVNTQDKSSRSLKVVGKKMKKKLKIGKGKRRGKGKIRKKHV